MFVWLCFHIGQLSGRKHRSGTALSADLYIVVLLERLIDVGHREGSARLSSLLVGLGPASFIGKITGQARLLLTSSFYLCFSTHNGGTAWQVTCQCIKSP